MSHKAARQVMGDETNEVIKQPRGIAALDVLPSLYLCEPEESWSHLSSLPVS